MEKEYRGTTAYEGDIMPARSSDRGQFRGIGFDRSLLPDTEIVFVNHCGIDGMITDSYHLPEYNVVLVDHKREDRDPQTERIDLQGYSEEVDAVEKLLRDQIRARKTART